MFSINELPRKDGVLAGDFLARHKSNTFELDAFGFQFRGGITVEPVRGIVVERLNAAFGSDITWEPRTREDGELAVDWMTGHGLAEERIANAVAALEERFPTAVLDEPPLALKELPPVEPPPDYTPPTMNIEPAAEAAAVVPDVASDDATPSDIDRAETDPAAESDVASDDATPSEGTEPSTPKAKRKGAKKS